MGDVLASPPDWTGNLQRLCYTRESGTISSGRAKSIMRETTRADGIEPVEGETAAASTTDALAPVRARTIQPETEPAAGTWAGRLTDWAARHPRAPLALALLLSLAARLFLVARTHAMIDGDEALVGIQAERILHGQYPVYFYSQPYMGSLEAYFAAALFRVFGPSAWALRRS